MKEFNLTMRVKKCINIFVSMKRGCLLLSDEKIISGSLRGLIKDMKKECEEFIGIANQLEQGDIKEDEAEEWLGEIMTSAVSLNIYSENIRNELDRSEIG
ncbi:MAG: hypothetical protein AAB257_00940 [Nitrospinota bacterium]